MDAIPLDILMFVGLCLFVLTGAPIAFVLAGTATFFGILGWFLGDLNFNLLGAYPTRVFSLMTSETLVAVPLFVFMGMILQRAKIAEELLETMGALFGSIRGGLAVSVTIVGALLAASTGIVGATTVTMGLMALPVMLRFGYSPAFASGTICSAGTLGQIIPPSTVLIIMGEVLGSAYQQAQHAQGNFAAKTISVGELFAGSLLPGLMLVGIYIVYQLIVALFRPDIAPPVRGQTENTMHVGLRDVLRTLFPPLILMIGVLGSIIGGIATATEAASVGAVGATLLAGRKIERHRWSLWVAVIGGIAVMIMAANFDLRLGRPNAPAGDRALLALAAAITLAVVASLVVLWRELARENILKESLDSTARITAMIFTIVIGAYLFSLVFRGLGGDAHIIQMLEAAPGGEVGAMFLVLGLMFVLGLFLDYVEITIIVIPVIGPPLLGGGIDPIWFGVLVALVMQTSFLTPPVGYTLAYLRSVAPREVTTGAIWRGAVPFIGLQFVAILIVFLVPGLATWLPSTLF